MEGQVTQMEGRYTLRIRVPTEYTEKLTSGFWIIWSAKIKDVKFAKFSSKNTVRKIKSVSE